MTIEVQKLNESYSLLKGPMETLRRISDYLKVERPGAYFEPAVRRGFISPWHYFAEVRGNDLLVLNGHLSLLKSFGIQEEPVVPDYTEEELDEFIEEIKGILPFEPYDFQVNAFKGSILNKKQINRMCTSCLDPESLIEILVEDYSKEVTSKEITYEEIHILLDKGINIKVDTPNGLKKILRKFEKYDNGKLIKYSDGTETRCAIGHHMIFKNTEGEEDLYAANELEVGFYNGNKTIISIEDLPEQKWLDFEIDDPSGLYYQNGITHHNSGKSVTISLIAEFFRRKGKKGLLLVPNINLLTQFHSDIESYNLKELHEGTYTIGAGQSDRNFESDLTISTWQSLQEQYTNGLDFSELDYIIGDEVHRLAADVPSHVIKVSSKCEYKLGFTGTLPEDPIMKMGLLGLFGFPETYITSRELISRGLGCPVNINSIILNYSDEDKKVFRGIEPTGRSKNKYPNQLNFIKEHIKRSEFITTLIQKLRPKGNQLVLFQHTEHGKEIFRNVMKTFHPDVEVQNKDITGVKSFEFQKKYRIYFLNGEDNARTREMTRNILEHDLDAILVANSALLSTGVSIRRLHSMVLASPIKAYTTVTQSIGRLMRLHMDKLEANVFDIVDNFGLRKPGGPFYKQYEHRLKTSYYPEEFPIKELTINL